MTQSLQSLLTDTFSLRRAWAVDSPEYPTDVFPLLYGDLTGGKGGVSYCPGIVESTFTYLIADHLIVSSGDGNSPTFYADTIVVSPSSWTPSTTVAGRQCATVTFATSKAGLRIGYRGKGKASGSTVITNPIDVVVDFLTAHVGVDQNDIDANAQADARGRAALAGYLCAGVLDLDRSPATTISEILSCFGGYYYLSPAGKIVLMIDDGTTPGLSGLAGHLRAHHFEGADATWRRADVINRAAVNFSKNSYDNQLTQKFQDADEGIDSQDLTSQRVHGPSGPGVTEAALEFPWTRDAATVQKVQRVIVARLATPRARIRTQIPTYQTVHLDVGDYVGFSWARLFDDNARPLKNQIAIVEEVAVDGDTPKVDLVIRDTGAYLSRGRRLDGTSVFGWTRSTGTVSDVNTVIGLEVGRSFVDLTGVDLTRATQLQARLTLFDSTGKRLVGWLIASGTGATYGAELLANGGFATDPNANWYTYNCTLASVGGGQSGNCCRVTKTGSPIQQCYQTPGTVAGAAYRASVYAMQGTSGGGEGAVLTLWSALAGNVWSQVFVTGSWQQIVRPFREAAGSSSVSFYLTKNTDTAGTMLFDTASLTQILTPSATGATIVSSRGGNLSQWASEDAGFNRNDMSGYTWALDGNELWKLGQDRDLRDY